MQLQKARVIFMGTSLLAEKVLKNLIKNKVNIELVITQPDKPTGRKKIIQSSEIKKIAKKNNLSLKQFRKINQETFRKIKSINPDLIVVVAYGIILPKEILQYPPYGCINIHPSLLPKLRGSSPIQTALLQGLEETGVTIMKMDTGIDSGDIIYQQKISVRPWDNYISLEKQIIKKIDEIFIKSIEKYLQQKIIPRKQNDSKASFTKLIKKTDGKINWKEEAEKIYNKFRAFYRWPQIYTFIEKRNKKQKIILTDIAYRKITPKNKSIGQVYKNKNEILIKTGKGSILLKKIKPENKNEMAIKDFLNGNPCFIENILK